MKVFFTTVCFVLLAWLAAQAQSPSCLPEGIVFYNQGQIDSFSIHYPGCHRVEGNVTIDFLSASNISGLSPIYEIGGNLTTKYTYSLSSLHDLVNLTTVDGNIEMEFTGVEEFELPHLKVVRGSIILDNCSKIKGFSTLTNLDSLGGITISRCPKLQNFNGLQGLSTIQGDVNIFNATEGLTSFTGLDELLSITGNLSVQSPGLLSFSGLGNLNTIGGSLNITHVPTLTNFYDFYGLSSIGGITVNSCPYFKSFLGLQNLTHLAGGIGIFENPLFESFNGLGNVDTIGSLTINNNIALKNLYGLNLNGLTGEISIINNDSLINIANLGGIKYVSGNVQIFDNDRLPSLAGLDNLDSIGGHYFIQNNLRLHDLGVSRRLGHLYGGLNLYDNPALVDITSLDSLRTISGGLWIDTDKSLASLSFHHLESIGGNLEIATNDSLADLTGLENLHSIGGDLSIYYNNALTNISSLSNVQSIAGNLWLFNNPALTTCAIYPVCNQIFNRPEFLNITDNGPGCSTPLEVELLCGGVPIFAKVQLDHNANCQLDSTDDLAEGVLVHIAGNIQNSIRPTQSDGIARFGYLNTGAFSASLPQFPTANWGVCQDTFWYLPDTIQDTIRTNFLLKPLNQCPDLSVDVWLPPFFRGCLATTPAQVLVRNAGTVTAENVQLAVVMPGELNLVSSVPPLTAQNGDTLFFDLGDLPPFAAGTVNMVVRTSCDNFLFGQTLCVEAFSSLANACPNNQGDFSEIRLFSECVNDTTVRFTLKNVGNVATQNTHEYVIIEDELILRNESFSLNALESLVVNVPSTGATYRMEATKYDDGTLTATARENCGGLTPGFITAYWLNDGRHNYDFDCRQVTAAYDPNQKTAVPTGVGPEHLLAANKPIQYTIEFQNTGTDTAFRVQLLDVLPPQLNPLSFRPGYASHAYTWQIIGGDSLEVLFSPIMLPDSLVNEAASHGWFSFDIDQRPDLPDGSTIENSASIVFDYNPPIVTNTVLHTIGKLTVHVDEPQAAGQTWQVLSNPARYAATFRSATFMPGPQLFELTDAMGRVVRTERFEGQTFEFRRGLLPGGLFYFRIYDASGKVTTGKIVLSD